MLPLSLYQTKARYWVSYEPLLIKNRQKAQPDKNLIRISWVITSKVHADMLLGPQVEMSQLIYTLSPTKLIFVTCSGYYKDY